MICNLHANGASDGPCLRLHGHSPAISHQGQQARHGKHHQHRDDHDHNDQLDQGKAFVTMAYTPSGCWASAFPVHLLSLSAKTSLPEKTVGYVAKLVQFPGMADKPRHN